MSVQAVLHVPLYCASNTSLLPCASHCAWMNVHMLSTKKKITCSILIHICADTQTYPLMYTDKYPCIIYTYIKMDRFVSTLCLDERAYTLYKHITSKTHLCLKFPYPVRNPELGIFFWAGLGLGLISLWSTGAIEVGCPSWHHQWPWWDSNPQPIDHEPEALSSTTFFLWVLHGIVMAYIMLKF